MLTGPNDIFTAYFNAAAHYAPLITVYAMHLWWLLTLLELIVIGITWMMGSDDLPEACWRIVRWIFTAGFAYWWIQQSWVLGLTVLGSFNQLGVELTGQPSLAPMAFIQSATNIAKLIFSAPSTHRMIPDIGLAIEEAMLSGLVYFSFLIIAALAVFTLVAAYIILSGGPILVPFLVSRFTSHMAEGYFTWLMRTGVIIFFFYLMLGIAQQLMTGYLATVTAICTPTGMILPSPLLGAPPVATPAIACTNPIPVNILVELFADALILAIVCGAVPFVAGSIVNHGINAAIEHLAAAKYLAGSASRQITRAVSTVMSRARQTSNSNNSSTLQQRMAAGAAASARVSPKPAAPAPNAFGVTPTQTFPQANGKPTTRI
jgi:P-type conjugative transfer protein TrbL